MGDESGDFKTKEKETYFTAITKKLINLGLEASKDGVREYYEDAVLDFWTDIPTIEKQRRFPKHLRGAILWPGIIIGEEDTPVRIFERIQKEFPVTPRDQPLAIKNNITRTYAIKQLTIDLYDEMGVLRSRVRKSKGSRTHLEKIIEEDWS